MAFPAVFDLSDLDGTNGFRLDGAKNGDLMGYSVSSAGDVNGDGYDDILIGGEGGTPSGSESLETYLVFGKASGWAGTIDLSALDGTDGVRLKIFGGVVSSAGDINGDGYDDVIVGVPETDVGAITNAGASYVIFGKAAWQATLATADLDGTNGFRVNGVHEDDFSGFSVSTVGDINHDGFDDFAIGAYLADPGSTMDAGATSVVFGDDSGWTTNFPIGSLNGSNGFTITGIGSLDWSGYSVSDAGDVNGDGIDDMLVGAPYAGLYGETYLIFGKTSGWTQTLDLSTLNGTNGVRLIGYAGSTGHSVSGAGDINGDGYADIVIGAPDGKAPGGNAGISQAGLSFVVFGKSLGWTSTLALSALNGTDGFVLQGIDYQDYSGTSVSSAGDINHDGFDDLMIGAFAADPPGGSYAGETYVVYGTDAGWSPAFSLSSIDGTNGFRIDGLAFGDLSGYSVSDAGDVNGDGVGDLLIGAYGGDYGGSGTGASYVIFGLSAAPDPIEGTPFDDPDLQGTEGDDVINGLAGNDTIDALGGDDTINGGPGADAIDGGTGSDTASYEGSAQGVNVQLQYGIAQGGDAAGDTLTSIENLIGSDHNDTLFGNPGINVIHGRGGNDIIKGLANADQLYGEDGDDWVYVDNPDTVATGDAGTDRLFVLGNLGVTNAVGVNGFEIATGNVGDDTFDGTGATANLTLRGLSGNDVLTGGSGDDYIYGGAGADELRGGDGLDRLFIDETDTVIDGGAGTADRVLVQQLASATTGVSVDMAASHVEVAYGNLKNDTFDGSGSSDALSLYGRGGADTLIGGSANDRLYGDNGTNVGDVLNGGAGNDYLYGGTNTGGWAERDQFVFDADWGADRIFDFADNGAEKIDFSSIAGITQRADLTITDGSGFALVSYHDTAGNWDASIRVDGLTAAQLQDNDFIFV